MPLRAQRDPWRAVSPDALFQGSCSTVVIVGAGYVGLVTGACLARLGHRVNTVDVDAARILSLQAGALPIVEPDLDELIGAGLAEGRLSFGTDLDRALRGADMAFIAVGTLDPEGRWTEANVRAVLKAILAAERVPPLIVIRSTLRPGTMQRFQQLVTLSGRATHLLLHPEFMREGSAVADFLSPHRIVVGIAPGDLPALAEPVRKLYAGVDAPFLVVDYASAELIKIGSNTFLAAKITFANELARLCVAAGADMASVREGLGLDPRIGPAFLQSGPGFGGSCLPSQVELVASMSDELGLGLQMLPAIVASNRAQPRRLVRDLLAELPTPKRVAVFGLAFKALTGDTRESPALRVIDALREAGVAEIRAYDPAVRQLPARPWVRVLSDPYDAARGADLLVIATEWPEFRALDWKRLAREMRGHEVFDARSVIVEDEALANGFRVQSLERRIHKRRPDRERDDVRPHKAVASHTDAAAMPI